MQISPRDKGTAGDLEQASGIQAELFWLQTRPSGSRGINDGGRNRPKAANQILRVTGP